MPTATTIAHLLDVVTADPGRPRLTWYGDDGERVELSGAVLANWVAKTTNLLVEELDAGPGVRVHLDLPPHWRTVTWALATWRCGAAVTLGDAPGAGVVVTDRPGRHARATDLVAVALPALARRFDGDLPAGAVDAAGAVMTYGDVVGWAPAVDPAAPALEPADGRAVSHAELLAWAGGTTPTGGTTPAGGTTGSGGPAGTAAATGAAAGPRLLVPADADRDAGVSRLLRATLGTLALDGSVVVLAPSVATELAADPARRSRLVEGERVTGTWDDGT